MRIVLAMALLAACSSQSNPGGPPNPNPPDAASPAQDMAQPPSTQPTPPMTLAPAPGPTAGGLSMSRLHLGSARDLWIRVLAPTLGAPSTLALTFVGPNGEAFYQDTTMFSSDPSVTSVPSKTLKHAIDVFPAQKVAGGYLLERGIPIAGTVFQRVPRTGPWKVQASVDGVMIQSTAVEFVW